MGCLFTNRRPVGIGSVYNEKMTTILELPNYFHNDLGVQFICSVYSNFLVLSNTVHTFFLYLIGTIYIDFIRS